MSKMFPNQGHMHRPNRADSTNLVSRVHSVIIKSPSKISMYLNGSSTLNFGSPRFLLTRGGVSLGRAPHTAFQVDYGLKAPQFSTKLPISRWCSFQCVFRYLKFKDDIWWVVDMMGLGNSPTDAKTSGWTDFICSGAW